MAEEKKFATIADMKNAVLAYIKTNKGATTPGQIQSNLAEISKSASATQIQEYGLKNSKDQLDQWKAAYFVLQTSGEIKGLPIQAVSDKKTPEEIAKEKEAKEAQKAAKRAASQISLTEVEQNVRQQLGARSAELREFSNNTKVVKIIKAQPDLIDVVKDASSASFVVDTFAAVDVLEKLRKDDTDNVIVEATRANYDALYDAVEKGTPIPAQISTTSNSWAGAVIKLASGETRKLSREQLRMLLIANSFGYIGSKDNEPVIKLKTVRKKNNKESNGQAVVKAGVVLGNMKEIKKDPNWFVSAMKKSGQATEMKKINGVDTPVEATRRTRSQMFYEVYVLEEDGKTHATKKDGTEKTRKRYINGSVACYPVVEDPEYALAATKKRSASKKSNGGMSEEDINNIFDLMALELTNLNGQKTDPIHSGEIDPEIREKLDSYSFAPAASTGAADGPNF